MIFKETAFSNVKDYTVMCSMSSCKYMYNCICTICYELLFFFNSFVIHQRIQNS